MEILCDGYTWPIVDTTASAVAVAPVTAYFVSLTDRSEYSNSDFIGLFSGNAGLLLVAFLVVTFSAYLGSAVWGYGEAGKCHEAKCAHDAWLKMTPDQQKEFEKQ
jgi:hypothetical protein